MGGHLRRCLFISAAAASKKVVFGEIERKERHLQLRPPMAEDTSKQRDELAENLLEEAALAGDKTPAISASTANRLTEDGWTTRERGKR